MALLVSDPEKDQLLVSALRNLSRRLHLAPAVPDTWDAPQRPDRHRHLFRPGVTDNARWAKHLIPNAEGHAR